METSNLHILNRIFTRNTLRHFIDISSDITYSSVVKRYLAEPDKKNNTQLISEIYAKLKQNYRNEYYYKNTLLNKLLLGVHSVNTTTALTEIPVAKSKADFVLINGKGVVYEIKSELDNFERLEGQIKDYYKAFDYVSVVTCQDNLPTLVNKLNIDYMSVGIYILQKNEKIKTIRKPIRQNEFLDSNVIFKILRKSEFENIILKYYGKLPDVSQVKYYRECMKLFNEIPIEIAHNSFLTELKKRNIIEKEYFCKIPYELKFLAYFMELKEEDYFKLDNFLLQNYRRGN